MTASKKLSWAEGNKFYATTGIAGFSFINQSKSRAEIIFWYLIIFAFAIITIRSLIILTVEYHNQEPLTNVEFQHFSDDRTYFKMYHFDICFKISPPEFHREFFNDEYIWTGEKKQYDKPLSRDVDLGLWKIKSKEQATARHLDHEQWGQPWSYALISVLGRYFGVLAECERTPSLSCFKGPKFSDDFGTYDFIANRSDPISIEADKILLHMEKLNISEGELLQLFGEQLKYKFELISVFDTHNYIELRLASIRRSQARKHSPLFYCYEPTQLPFRIKRNSTFFFSAHLEPFSKEYMYHGATDSAERAMEFMFGPKPGISILLDVGKDVDGPDIHVVPGQQDAWYEMSLRTAYKRIDCLDHPSGLYCTDSCRLEVFQKLCQCVPPFIASKLNFTSLEIDPSLPFCRPEHYFSCDGDAALKECMFSCKRECHSNFYHAEKLKVQPDREDWFPGRGEMKAVILFHESYYTNFTQVVSQSWQSFLAELGGAFDFWLGASVVAGIHLMIFMIKQIYYTVTGRNRKEIGILFRQIKGGHFVSGFAGFLAPEEQKRKNEKDEMMGKIEQFGRKLMEIEEEKNKEIEDMEKKIRNIEGQRAEAIEELEKKIRNIEEQKTNEIKEMDGQCQKFERQIQELQRRKSHFRKASF